MKKKIWDLYAPVYKRAMKADQKVYDYMYTRIPEVIRDKVVLEIATGPGLLAKHVASAAKQMIATDYSDGMIAEARKGDNPANLSFEIADAMDLPYADDSFDAVIIANALHIIPDPENVLGEIDRVLKDGGILIAPNFVEHKGTFISSIWSEILKLAGVRFEHQWTAQEYLQFLRDNGWKIRHSREMSARITLMYAECIKNSDNKRITINQNRGYQLLPGRENKHMSLTDNFGNPQGLLGRMMLVSMEREHLPMAKWAFPQLDVPQEGNILDIGCGGGYNVRRLLEASPNGKIVGLDISEESVRKAKKINKKEIGKRCRIGQGSVENMPFQDGKFDLVTAFETVFFWPDLSKDIREVYRVVKLGGRFAVINNYGDPKIDWEKKVPCMKRYTAEEIRQFMENAGFANVTIAKKDNLFLLIGEKK